MRTTANRTPRIPPFSRRLAPYVPLAVACLYWIAFFGLAARQDFRQARAQADDPWATVTVQAAEIAYLRDGWDRCKGYHEAAHRYAEELYGLLAECRAGSGTPMPDRPFQATMTAERATLVAEWAATADAADTAEGHALASQQAHARGTPWGWPSPNAQATEAPTSEPTPTAPPPPSATPRPYTVTPGPSPTSPFTRRDLIATWTAAAATRVASYTKTPTAAPTPTPSVAWLPFTWRPRR